MTILPHILNLASIICGLVCASFALLPGVGAWYRVFWAVAGVLCVLRGVL